MAGALKPHESAVKGIRRLARRQVSKVLDELKGDLQTGPALSSEVIHSVRKRLKRTRALLRLARQAAGLSGLPSRERGLSRRGPAADRGVAMPKCSSRRSISLSIGWAATLSRWPRFAPRSSSKKTSPAARCSTFKKCSSRFATRSKKGQPASTSGTRVATAGRFCRRASNAFIAADKTPARPPANRQLPSGCTSGASRPSTCAISSKCCRPIWPVVMDDLIDKMKQLGNLLGDDHDLAVLRDRLDDEHAFPELPASRRLAAGD